MAEIKEIKVWTRIQDNGDGGFSAYCYGTPEERLADYNEYKDEDEQYKTVEEFHDAIDRGQIDDYNDGYMSDDIIKVKIDGDKITLAETISFSGGQ